MNSRSKRKFEENTFASHGVVCFTFDDRNFQGWISALPLFKKYNAHATFFFCGPVDSDVASTMRQLLKDGHTVGLHTLNHHDAPEYFQKYGSNEYIAKEIQPQLDACRTAGIIPKVFAYPNNLRNGETDHALSGLFHHFRAGLCPTHPEDIPLQEFEPMFQPVSGLPERIVMGGAGIGEYYHTKVSELVAVLRRAADKNEVVVFFSHNIAPDAKSIHMPLTTLETCLKTASELKMRIVGFDELPHPQKA